MEKKIKNNIATYTISWTHYFPYHRIRASRILPELPGILFFAEQKGPLIKPLFCFATWRDGMRMAMRDLFDPLFSKQAIMMKYAENKDLRYRYAIVDSNPKDLQDVFYKVLTSYTPPLNVLGKMKATERYDGIILKELEERHS